MSFRHSTSAPLRGGADRFRHPIGRAELDALGEDGSRPASAAPLRPPADAATVVVTAVGGADGSRAAAAALACAGVDGGTAPLLLDLGGRAPRPTLVASAAARALEERLAAHLPVARVAARGGVCHLAVPADPEGIAVGAAAVTVARGALAVVHAEPAALQPLLTAPEAPRFTGALLRAEVAAARPLLALVVRDLLERELVVAVLKRRLRWVAERRALFGALAVDSGEGLTVGLARRLLDAGRVDPPTQRKRANPPLRRANSAAQ